MAFAVSITEPPPTAIIKSAPDTFSLSSPVCTLAIVGLGLTSSSIS